MSARNRAEYRAASRRIVALSDGADVRRLAELYVDESRRPEYAVRTRVGLRVTGRVLGVFADVDAEVSA